jgi:hypothetical protein
MTNMESYYSTPCRREYNYLNARTAHLTSHPRAPKVRNHRQRQPEYRTSKPRQHPPRLPHKHTGSRNGSGIYLGMRMRTVSSRGTASMHNRVRDAHAMVVVETTWLLRNLRKLRSGTSTLNRRSGSGGGSSSSSGRLPFAG